MLTLALLVLFLDLRPHSLDAMTVERARTLHGQQVAVTFLAAKPSHTWRGQTIVGADDQPDGVERGTHLKGNRIDADMGKRVTVTGTLRVIDHPGYFVNQRFVPPWTEIRVEEGK